MIKLENVVKKYDDFTALKGIDLQCKEGEITVLIGPSGCGKTTTLELLNRLSDPTSGKIYINGEDISNVNPVYLRRKIGYVIQHIGLFPHMTIAENISVVPKLLKWDKQRIASRIEELLSLVNLPPETYSNRYPKELSGGQQQRIGVVRALAAEPSIILMDEPFSALDPISREQLQEELVHLQEDIKKTIVFVTHDIDEALKIADRIILMKDGQIVQQGTVQEVLSTPVNDFVKDFIGQKRLENYQNTPSVGDVMSDVLLTISPTDTLTEALEMMKSNRMDSLVVISDANKLYGYISIFDVYDYLENGHEYVKDIAKTLEYTLHSSMLLTETTSVFNESELSYVPVIDSNNTLLGILTRESIFKHLGMGNPPGSSEVRG